MHSLITPLVLTASLFALPHMEAPREVPVSGTQLVKVLRHTAEVTGAGLEVFMAGQPVPPEFLPDLSFEMLAESEVHVIDRYEQTSDGAVGVLVRSFETTDFLDESSTELEQQGSVTSSEEARTGSSLLLGKSVRFTCDEGSWSARLEGDEELPAASLEGLSWNLEFRSWAFPEEPGDQRWSLPGAAFAQLAEPCGELSLEWSGDAQSGASLPSIFGGELEFRRTSAAGAERIEVQISGEVLWTTRSLTELVDIPMTDGEATLSNEQQIELEGELIWDAKAGHLISLSIEGSMQGSARLLRDSSLPGPTFESRTPIQGSLNWSVEFKPAGQ